MFKSTLCYLRNNGRTLMMLRDMKENDVNEGKWIGIGGKFEINETASECLLREVKEETGIELASFLFHGIIYFRNDEYEDEEMYLYSAHISDEQALSVDYECTEGTLRFIDDNEIKDLNLWEGDRIFLKDLYEDKIRISYDLTYENGKLKKCEKIPVGTVIFDLDGTLIDTGEGIMKCAQYSLENIGIEVEDYHDLSFFVGPPLMHTYTVRYGVSEEKARELIRIYRERYEPEGVFECELYPGVKECLINLREKGYKICIGSSKPEHMCVKLLKHFGLSELFDEVCGATPDGKIDTKAEVLTELFRRGKDDTEFISGCVLVGDTGFDISGAAGVGISSIGVSFGYGNTGEMKKLGASSIADSMEEIPGLIEKI
ncbi:MAG: HAD hydrolase-like protein [Lachnospiraceae bacterium]|nr:HAD hydrolase-like protein [Lachnospiraceae bacterium]